MQEIPEWLKRETQIVLSREEYERRLKIFEELYRKERVDPVACAIMALLRENIILRENVNNLQIRSKLMETKLQYLEEKVNELQGMV